MRTIPQQTVDLTITEVVVVGLLAEGKRSGYDLVKRAEASVGHMWSPAKSQLYAVLPRLVDAGLARRRSVRQQGRPDKQVYWLTPAGRRALRAWLEHPSPRSWDELLLKVFFGKHVPATVLLPQLETYREVESSRLADYRAIEREIASNPDRRHGYLTLRYGLSFARSRLRWLDETMKELSR